MNISLFLSCKFELTTILIKFDGSGDFVDKLCENFEMTHDNATITYFVRGHVCVLLRN